MADGKIRGAGDFQGGLTEGVGLVVVARVLVIGVLLRVRVLVLVLVPGAGGLRRTDAGGPRAFAEVDLDVTNDVLLAAVLGAPEMVLRGVDDGGVGRDGEEAWEVRVIQDGCDFTDGVEDKSTAWVVVGPFAAWRFVVVKTRGRKGGGVVVEESADVYDGREGVEDRRDSEVVGEWTGLVRMSLAEAGRRAGPRGIRGERRVGRMGGALGPVLPALAWGGVAT